MDSFKYLLQAPIILPIIGIFKNKSKAESCSFINKSAQLLNNYLTKFKGGNNIELNYRKNKDSLKNKRISNKKRNNSKSKKIEKQNSYGKSNRI